MCGSLTSSHSHCIGGHSLGPCAHSRVDAPAPHGSALLHTDVTDASVEIATHTLTSHHTWVRSDARRRPSLGIGEIACYHHPVELMHSRQEECLISL